MSGVTDPYQPRRATAAHHAPVPGGPGEVSQSAAIVTKNHLVTAMDLLADLAADGAAHVNISVTTLREDLRRVMEPHLHAGAAAGGDRDPGGGRRAGAVMVAPIIPGLNDVEVPSIVEAAASAGAAATWIRSACRTRSPTSSRRG